MEVRQRRAGPPFEEFGDCSDCAAIGDAADFQGAAGNVTAPPRRT
jgi:hypothetical protein